MRRGGVAIALVLASLAGLHGAVRAARWIWDDAGREPGTGGRILAAAEGSVLELVIQFHRDGADRFLPVYRDIFGALDPATRVTVVVSDREDARLFEAERSRWDHAPGVRYVVVGRPITSWARDRLAVLDDEGTIVLLAPPRPMRGPGERVHDWLVPWALRRELGTAAVIRTAPFVFDGGDLIADERFVYVATPLLARNPGREPREILEAVGTATGRTPLLIGDEAHPVPDHHIGMFVTPLGSGRVAYADPDAGLRALGKAALLEAGSAADQVTVEVGGEPLQLDLRPERLDLFRNVRDALAAAGLETVPIPVVPADGQYVFLGYNNVLLDRRADGLHVLMPAYGVDALDRAAADAWRAQGAAVHPIDVSGIFRLGGTVRCLTAPLRRL